MSGLEKIESGDLTLSFGSKDSTTNGAVSAMQQFLIDEGFDLPKFGVDGIFEDETESAVNAFRSSRGLPPTGVFDATALSDHGPVGKALNWINRRVRRSIMPEKEIKNQDANYAGVSLNSLSQETGIEPAFLMAILKQESAGNPSAIRFEPHLFNKYSKNGKMPFTPASGKSFSLIKSETNKSAFRTAFKIDPEAAVRSTSWGLGQVLGGHLLSLYGQPEAAVKAFYNNPKKVSFELIIKWIKANPSAVKAAKEKNFADFARIYNGANYKMNNYDNKLEQHYNASQMELA